MSRTSGGLAEVSIYTFGSHTLPLPVVKYYVDVTKYRDPAGQPTLAGLDGRDGNVMAFVKADRRIPLLLEALHGMVHAHIVAAKEGHITIGIEDKHGRWIAPAVGELVAEHLDQKGFRVSLVHRAFS